MSAPTRTCRIYGSASGFGLLCSDAAAGKTLAQLLRDAGIDVTKAFCWDDPDLPDGFEPEVRQTGPGRWWLHTCLSFDGPVTRTNADLSYEYRFLEPGDEHVLTQQEQGVIELVTGRGQIPYLQVQTSPVSSPRVDQDVAFSMLCDAKVRCTDTAAGRAVAHAVAVGRRGRDARRAGAHAGAAAGRLPARVEVGCTGAGLPRNAQQLDEGDEDDAARLPLPLRPVQQRRRRRRER